MIAVIFEVELAAGSQPRYLQLAAALAQELAAVDGFISIERFASLTTPDKVLSLSFWRDEAAVQAWRQTALHREAQRQGRGGVFADYRLRVAQVQRDYGMQRREEAPADSKVVLGP